MKLLRHILSHLFFISFLIAVVSVFYYRTLLLPNDMVGKIDAFVKGVYPPALSFVSSRDYFWSIRGERIVSFDDLNLFEKENNVTDKKMTDTILASETKSNTPVATETAVKPEEIAVVQREDKIEKKPAVIIAKVNEPAQENKRVSVPVESQIKNIKVKNNKVEDVPVVIKDSNTSSERDLLISARNAFNQGKVIQSEKFYLELTLLAQNNPDIFGELGNVYYSQGKWDKAGQAYYEAAVRLITEGNRNQVVYLQRVIKGLNTKQAEKLAQLMMRQ